MRCEVSWLRLEAYVLDEVDATERAEIASHLARCADCRARLAAITEDHRPMPAWPGRRSRWWTLAPPLLAAALALVVVGLATPTRWGTKGGDLALSLTRWRSGDIAADRESYLSGDRFQVAVTCPPGDRRYVLAVFEGEAPAVALGEGTTSCGNARLLPDAFAVSGTQVIQVCVAFDPPPPPWLVVDDLGSETVCRQLRPLEP